jgi:hypothetical protein
MCDAALCALARKHVMLQHRRVTRVRASHLRQFLRRAYCRNPASRVAIPLLYRKLNPLEGYRLAMPSWSSPPTSASLAQLCRRIGKRRALIS